MPTGVPLDKRAGIENAGRNCPVAKSVHPDLVQTLVFVYPSE